MYSWGGSTADWKKPGAYKYDSAKSPYLDSLASAASARGPRSYSTGREPDMGLVDPSGKKISSDSKNPLVVAIDVTGSMATWPAEIFDRLPLLYQTLSQYREDLEVCFSAIGDANCDSYPLQVNDFEKGLGLEEKLKALGAEGGGGGQISESYELFAYFMREHCSTPNATSPFLLIYGDEKFYSQVKPEQVNHYIGDNVNGALDSKNLWTSLLQKYEVYFLHKPYGAGNEPDIDRDVVGFWANAIGKQRIIELPSCDRAVDIAMGLVAKSWGEYSDFTRSLDARQPDSEVQDAVHTSLRMIDGDPSSASVVSGRKSARKTKSLTS